MPVGFGALVFGVPMRGRLLELAVMAAFWRRCRSAGCRLLIAARARTIEGVSGLMNLVQVPMWVLSGVFFSSENFRTWCSRSSRRCRSPRSNDALRANMLQGFGLVQLAPQLAVLAAWLVVCFGLALRLFRWK